MKKALPIAAVVLIFITFSAVLYSNYSNVRFKEYLRFIPNAIENMTGEKVKNFKLDRLVKKSLNEIIILVVWDSNSAYISIEDWLLPRKHDEIRIRFFDSKRSIVIME